MTDRGCSRRQLLTGGIAAATLAGCGGGFRYTACDDPSAEALTVRSRALPEVVPIDDAASLPEQLEHFRLGVSSGDAYPDGATLWTRHDADRPLAVAVWREGMRGTAGLRVTEATGGFVHATLGDLRPGTWYRFAFVELEGDRPVARSPLGRFRTALAPDALEPLTVGALACVNKHLPHDALLNGSQLDMDLFLFLGDSAYCDGSTRICEFRQAWDATLRSEGYRALRGHQSVLATWDDHEVTNDFDRVTADPVQFAHGLRAFFEHQPIRRYRDAPRRIWRRRRWGRTAEIFVLDTRGERDATSRNRPDAHIMSDAQLEWLMAGLRDSEAVFKIVMTSVPISDFPLLFEPKSHDRWESFHAQRQRLLRFAESLTLPGLIWVAGDFHMSSAGHVGARPGAPGWNQLEVLAGPGAQHGNPLWTVIGPPQFHYSSNTDNVTTLELDPETVQVRVKWHAADRILGDLTYDLRHGMRLASRREPPA
ncbi:MAG TPA: alkaline phosphatase D family protein [Sandaracinaceae bacterium LLY-WYZ-13_1]|nr:alkaline phosphatase D family protein [Sandaracinaceae bacterium LLY-WYZ-13_1]